MLGLARGGGEKYGLRSRGCEEGRGETYAKVAAAESKLEVKEAGVGGLAVTEVDGVDKSVGEDAEDDGGPDPFDEVQDQAAAFE